MGKYVTYQFATVIATYDTETEQEAIAKAENDYIEKWETTDRQGDLVNRSDYYHDISSGKLVVKKEQENPMTPMYEAGMAYQIEKQEAFNAEIEAMQKTAEGRLALKMLHNIKSEDWEEWHLALGRNKDGTEREAEVKE